MYRSPERLALRVVALAVLASACLALIASAAALAADDRIAPFAVGVMRRDGELVPIAAFTGRRWTVDWPAPTAGDLSIPISLKSVPKGWWGPTPPLAEWQVWGTNGQSTVARVRQPDWIDVHCVRQIALKTDYRGAGAPPATEQPYPKDGLAVSPPRAVEPIEIVPRASAEVSELTAVFASSFNTAERDVADRFGHPLKTRQRERDDPQIEAVYAFGTSPRVYYVEGARGYQRENYEKACLLSFGTGWFVRGERGAIRALDMAVDVLSCNRYGASYMLPLGVLRLGARTFWVAQYSGWDHERFVVIEIKKDKVEAVVNAWGGGC